MTIPTDLLRLLPRGSNHPASLPSLAAKLGVSTRTIQEMAAELVEAGELVGSRCDGPSGLFLIESMDDLSAGTAHIVARAAASLRRVRLLERNAARKFGPEALTLFSTLEEAS